MAELPIDLFTDVVCPWCYIGFNRLEQARPTSGEAVSIRHHPFLLDPSTPLEGVSIADMLRAKYGVDPKTMFLRVEVAARESGLELDLSKQPRMYPTLRAHTLVRLAREKGNEHALVGSLFRAYFDEAKNISDPSILIELGASHGLDAGEIERAVDDEAELERTKVEAREAVELGIRGVPFYVFDKRFAVSGAQPIELLSRAMDEAIRHRERGE
jgi:predicted DsbA family dithiol-disulfide isomerase